MFGNALRRIAALSLVAKVILAVAALIVLALSVVLSPLVALVALVVLIVAVIALIFCVLRRRPLRNWGLVALVSLLLLIMFSGITNALYGGGAPQQTSSPSESAEETEPTPPETTETATSPETTAETTETASAPLEPAEEETSSGGDRYDATVTVTSVVDGDTVRIRPTVDGYDEVRLIGVDTPETRDSDCEIQPYGPEASAFTTFELQGEEVELEFDEERIDRYDRLLAYVYKDEEMFNETLLEEGYAQVATFPPNDEYVDRFEEAQAEAQAAERGIWALSAAEQAQLTDRGNGIGGSGCIPKTPPPSPQPAPNPNPSPAPSPTPTPDVPSAPARSTPPPSPPSSSSAGGVDCSVAPGPVPVSPGSKGDRDRDGVACEK